MGTPLQTFERYFYFEVERVDRLRSIVRVCRTVEPSAGGARAANGAGGLRPPLCVAMAQVQEEGARSLLVKDVAVLEHESDYQQATAERRRAMSEAVPGGALEKAPHGEQVSERDSDQGSDLKSLRRIYSRDFPLLYAATMAGVLAFAHNRGVWRVRGYLSPDEARVIPRLFPLEHRGGYEYCGETSRVIAASAARMPVFYDLILIAAEQTSAAA
ncbi:hypothetical protein CKO15_05280 [Halorhodospira abdelmalekii]|uniref:hypothetical protein n=1 Tax=Halorhodospira abdelmalekii TaxID=421629 RepID=UPI0019064309|nr:hypothetical protein [Halorhodospira abdelmalekii]MBK1734708.1 hypothetical protein [Halorhodospira abdelmalekii]